MKSARKLMTAIAVSLTSLLGIAGSSHAADANVVPEPATQDVVLSQGMNYDILNHNQNVGIAGNESNQTAPQPYYHYSHASHTSHSSHTSHYSSYY